MTEQNDYYDMPALINDISPLIPPANRLLTVRNAIRRAIQNSNHIFIPNLNINNLPIPDYDNLPPLLPNPSTNINNIEQVISPLPGDYQINFDAWYDERTGFVIQPYLTYIGNNNNNQSIIRFNQIDNWNLFEMVARTYEKVVFITINAINELPEYKTIICPQTLINNYVTCGDRYIIINERPVYCAPDSELYRGCEWALEHTQPFHYNE